MITLYFTHSALSPGKSSRVCAPRLSSRISAARVTASDVTSSERIDSASCQPGLYWLAPGGLQRLRFAS